jgi:ferredoxin
MHLSSIIFTLVTLIVGYQAVKGFGRILDNIRMGRSEPVTGDTDVRWRRVVLIAFGQQKMFKRLLPAVLHFFIYAAFLLTQVELIEILVDGFTAGHRSLARFLGPFYTILIGFIELLSLLALVATVVFLARRNLLRLPRFWKAEMTAWPRLDANLILVGEILLVGAIFTMNGADYVLQGRDPAHYPPVGGFPVSAFLGPALFGDLPTDWLMWLERLGWWGHVLIVFAFIVYLPYSKHLHIFLAFFNAYFARLSPRGRMANMPEIQREVRSMLGLPVEAESGSDAPSLEFGAKDVTQLSWRTILGAYSCTECGRCTAVCPANLTGKKLSPRKVMMDIRDRAEEVGIKLRSGSAQFIRESDKAAGELTPQTFDDGRSLFDYITAEEIDACTTCNACVEACPVLIDPLEPILELRRYQILTESKGPAEWVPMFNALEGGGAVWQVPDARSAWTSQVNKA